MISFIMPKSSSLSARKESVFNDIWDFRDQIHLLDVPALLVNGEYDYMSDGVCGPFFEKMPKIKWVKFTNSSHMPHWEERDRYMDILRVFLQSWDRYVRTVVTSLADVFIDVTTRII